ncbi:hypothetical protein CHS0354_022942 [Potamilus streckersoni]|uniref:RalBP1-associated Eps domain-containing protein 1 n=1 Tax=Potamilus streckersoni TaxID=2493646 RepID=A0AAE0S5I0_9BIVA|nr:hypothetical protein CHS0354_022942 [Potamilus streckersoni]
MKGLKLTDQEQTYYGELFQSCDVDGSGKVSGAKASELFKTSGLTQEILVQVTESCGAKRLGHFGRSQFYIALKLVAAAQCGLPISTDTLIAGVDVPLPKFHRSSDQGAEPRAAGQHPGIPVSTGQEVTMALAADRLSQQQLTGQLPPPPASKKAHARNQSGQYRSLTTTDATQQYAPQDVISQQETRSPTFSPSQSPVVSPIVSPQQVPITSGHISIHNPSIPPVSAAAVTISLPTVHFPVQPQIVASQAHGHADQEDSPAHHQQQNTMGPNDIGWASFDDEEKHGLLGTGPKKNWEHLEPPNFDSSSISSDPESVDDVWSITDEQREYYVKQFQTMQPDISGVIVGSVAKEFFEKSKLPIQELSKIWQLSDINQDGALNLEEFCIAMHLVVLRRNEIEIPDRLPFALMPYTAFSNDSPFSRDLPPGSTLKRATPTSSPDAQATNWAQVLLQDSPLTSSDMSSPGIKPANFEFQKPDASDPEAKIVHPVPMRMSPTGHSSPPEGRDRDPVPGDSDLHDIETSVPITKQRTKSTLTSNSEIINNNTLQGRPRPVPKKGPVPSALPGNLLLSAVASSQSQSLEQSVAESTNEPPVPPPRPQQHARSMSVDLKGGLSAPPAVPPRASSKDAAGVKKRDTNSNALIAERMHQFAPFQKFQSIPSQEAINVITDSGDKEGDAIINANINERHKRSISVDCSKMKHEMEVDGAGESGASAVQLSMEVRRVSPAVTWDLLGEDFTDGSADRQPFTTNTTTITSTTSVYPVRDKKELQIAIRTHKERNSMLTRLNSELNQEYQEVMEQRIALEIQLEHLRPFSS